MNTCFVVFYEVYNSVQISAPALVYMKDKDTNKQVAEIYSHRMYMDYKLSQRAQCVCVCLKQKKRGLGVTSVRRPRTGDYMLFYNGVYILHNAAEYSVAIGSSPNFQHE